MWEFIQSVGQFATERLVFIAGNWRTVVEILILTVYCEEASWVTQLTCDHRKSSYANGVVISSVRSFLTFVNLPHSRKSLILQQFFASELSLRIQGRFAKVRGITDDAICCESYHTLFRCAHLLAESERATKDTEYRFLRCMLYRHNSSTNRRTERNRK